MKAKKLLRRVMDSRVDKKTSKKVRKRNTKFLANLYWTNAPADEPAVRVVRNGGPTKEDWIAWVKREIEIAKSNIDEADLADPVKSFTMLSVEFEFWDPQKDPVKVLLSDAFNINRLLKSVTVVDADTTEVDPNPEQETD